jgi:thiol:disulfide interchange protein
MYQTFLAIISLLAGAYAFWTRQVKMGLGFLILAGAFILLIPNLTVGIKTDIFGALAMALFVLGSLLIVWKKKPRVEEKRGEEDINA